MELSSPVWTEAELDESILTLCDEFPEARMAACSRAVEHCRWSTPRGTPEMLLRHATEEQLAVAMPLVEVSQHITRAGIQEMLARQ